MYDVHMMNRMATERRTQHMHDSIQFHVMKLDGEEYVWPHNISDELKETLMREFEFGVNLPVDQEFVLNVRIEMRHHVG